MNLTAKISLIVLTTVSLLVGGMAWVDFLGERAVLQRLLDEQGKAITRVLASFGVEALLLRDYPVLETVLKNVAMDNDRIESIEVQHEGQVVAFFHSGRETGLQVYEEDIVVDAGTAGSETLGKIRLYLSTAKNKRILEGRINSALIKLVTSLTVLFLTLVFLLREAVLKRIMRLDAYAKAIEIAQQKSRAEDIRSNRLPNGLPSLEGIKNEQDEIGHLARSLQSMHSAIMEKEGSMREYNRRLESAVTDRTRELLQSMKTAEKANQAKSIFLANMSHEIRTPMNGVLSMAQILSTMPLTADQQRYVQYILDSGRSLLTILNDILDYSKLEAAQIRLAKEDFSLRNVLEECVNLFGPEAAAKGLLLRLDLSDDLPEMVSGDQNRLMQVIANFVSNAIKFTQRGQITLAARASVPGNGCHRIRFTVEDTGIGVSEEEADVIFDRFTQVDDSLSRGQRGTGLGLAICRKLATAMGGELGLDSSPGEGSTFWFDVSLEAPLSPEIALKATASTVSALVSCTILLVEDDAINRLAARTLLEKSGHRVVLAENGDEALDRLGTEQVDIVLMDIHMPVMDGLAATRNIRTHHDPRIRSLPIIALTASVMEEERAGYLKAGMDDVAPKPLDMKRLNQLIAKLAIRRN